MTRAWLAAVGLLAVLGSGPAHALEGLAPGMKAPPLSLEALDGRRVGFADFPGARAFLVVFWAGWSQKSPEALERAQKLHTALGPRGLVVLGVNVESPSLTADELRAVRARTAELGLSFPVLLDRGLAAFHAWGVVAVPSSVLVGGDQTVLATLAAFPIAGREEFFDEVEAAVTGRPHSRPAAPRGPQPAARAVRYFHLGRDLATRGQVERGVANLQKAVEADASFVLPRILLGQLLRERALAADAVQTGAGRVPTLRLGAGERERLLGEAERHLTEALRLDPRSPAAMTELALLRRARGEHAGARELLERAVAAGAEYPPARSHLGALLVETGEEPRGRAELEAAIRLNPVDWRLHVTAAQAYEARGLGREALQAWKQGVELLWRARLGRGRDDGSD